MSSFIMAIASMSLFFMSCFLIGVLAVQDITDDDDKGEDGRAR